MHGDPPDSLEPTLEERLRSWERLRWLYNAVMLAVGVAGVVVARASPSELLHSGPPMDAAEVVLRSIAFGILANLAFLLGPAGELYAIAFARLRFGRFHRYALSSASDCSSRSPSRWPRSRRCTRS